MIAVCGREVMTLGTFTNELERLIACSGDRKEQTVLFDFGYFVPDCFMSWRGSYSEIALGFDKIGSNDLVTPSKLLKYCKESVGSTFEGYKGGMFTMTASSRIHIAEYGTGGNTVVVGLHRDSTYIYILTSIYSH